jgi:hypothetical protein
VLFVQLVVKYAGKVRQIYSFFGGREKREGKSSSHIFAGKCVG